VVDVLFVALQVPGLFGRELARLQALLDALLLVDVALLVLFSNRVCVRDAANTLAASASSVNFAIFICLSKCRAPRC
jgi:hypothetical protein